MGMRYHLEIFPTNPRIPSSIWDFETPEDNWYRLVAVFRLTTTMKEAEIMCEALNRAEEDQRNERRR